MARIPRTLRLVLALVGLILVLAPAAGAQGAAPATGPSVGLVHQVDATTDPVSVSVFTDALDIGADRVSIVENGRAVEAAAVDRASALGRSAELVYVVDTSERLAAGGAFDTIKEALAAQVRSLPEGTRVAVVAAGDLALVRQPLTADRELAAAAVGELRMGTTAALWDAVNKAADQFSAAPDRFRTVVVLSSAADDSPRTSAATARTNVLRAGAQVITLRYRGGDPMLTTLTDEVGGSVFGVRTDDELTGLLDRAQLLARDRLVVQYASGVDTGQLAKVDLVVDGLATSFSFTGGAAFDRVTSLAPMAPPPSPGLPVVGRYLQGHLALYSALLLAVVGVSLAVWSLGSLVVRTDENIDGRLSRYSLGDEVADEERSSLGQSAFIRRAVAVTENLARDRGVLAKTERSLEKANLPLRPAEALFAYAVIVVLTIVFSLLLTRSLLGALFFGFLGAGLPVLVLNFKVSRRQRKFEQQLPDALQLLAGTLRAGYSLPQGMEAVSHEIEDPMGFELRRVMSEARLGRELEEALESAAERLGSPDFAWAVMAIAIQREVGGNLNELLMTVSDTMVAHDRIRGEIKTLTAEGKMSAIILGGLPPGLGLVMWVMNPEYINTLFTETLGRVFIGLALTSATIGLLWMKKVITIDV